MKAVRFIASIGLALFPLVAMPSPAAQSDLTLRVEEIVGGGTRTFAERVLGAERAADVESFRADSDSMLGGLITINFFHRPTAPTAGFCRRIVDLVWLRVVAPPGAYPDRRQGPFRIGDVSRHLQIAMSRACQPSADLAFATLQPGVLEETAIDALRNFAVAIQAARDDQALPFELTCRDELPLNGCRGDGRPALANLEIREVRVIEAGSIVVGAPNHAPWEIRLMAFGTPHAGVTMVREVPAPF